MNTTTIPPEILKMIADRCDLDTLYHFTEVFPEFKTKVTREYEKFYKYKGYYFDREYDLSYINCCKFGLLNLVIYSNPKNVNRWKHKAFIKALSNNKIKVVRWLYEIGIDKNSITVSVSRVQRIIINQYKSALRYIIKHHRDIAIIAVQHVIVDKLFISMKYELMDIVIYALKKIQWTPYDAKHMWSHVQKLIVNLLKWKKFAILDNILGEIKQIFGYSGVFASEIIGNFQMSNAIKLLEDRDVIKYSVKKENMLLDICLSINYYTLKQYINLTPTVCDGMHNIVKQSLADNTINSRQVINLIETFVLAGYRKGVKLMYSFPRRHKLKFVDMMLSLLERMYDYPLIKCAMTRKERKIYKERIPRAVKKRWDSWPPIAKCISYIAD